VRQAEGTLGLHTRLGWVLSGPAPAAGSDKRSFSLVTTHTLHVGSLPCDAKSVNDTLQSFWDLESLGIKEPDRSVFTEFEESIQFRNGRCEVSLPWKDPHPVLPDNYQLCLKRLHGLLRRLRQDPNMLNQYDSIIRDQIERGIIQPVEIQANTAVGKVHYLPHHAVVCQDKETTKLRMPLPDQTDRHSTVVCILVPNLTSESWTSYQDFVRTESHSQLTLKKRF
jgi:hypothetical protein